MDVKSVLMRTARPLYKIAAKKKYNLIKDYIKESDSIIDIGSGSCYFTSMLADKGHAVIPIDIRNYSLIQGITPVIYDGKKTEFKNKEFSVALLSNVLHHTYSPIELLKEARRVSERVIIIEDVFNSRIGKLYTCMADSLLSMEFLNHPHSNKTDIEWKRTFRLLKMRLLDSKNSFIDIQKVSIYHLKC